MLLLQNYIQNNYSAHLRLLGMPKNALFLPHYSHIQFYLIINFRVLCFSSLSRVPKVCKTSSNEGSYAKVDQYVRIMKTVLFFSSESKILGKISVTAVMILPSRL